MRRAVPWGTLVLAGMAAGGFVGLVDGACAALAARTGFASGLTAALLVAAVDAILAASAGGVVEGFARAHSWGRARPSARWAIVISGVVFGLVTSAASIFAAVAGIDRRNRFLAAGVSAGAALVAGALGAALWPVLARLLSRGRDAKARSSARSSSAGVDVFKSFRLLRPSQARAATAFSEASPVTGLLLFGPFAALAVCAVIMSAVIELRAPLGSARAMRRLILTGFEAALLPALLSWATTLPIRIKLRWAIFLASVVFGGPALAFGARHWSDHLRFLPWLHVLPAFVIAAIALALLPLFARWCRRARAATRVALALLGLVFASLVTLAASELETARKVTFGRVGLAGPTLTAARGAFDGDRDGYAGLLGGGDCDDGDSTVHPGILDYPDDGVDQDCDGKDASVSVLSPPPFAAVPASVPADLNLVLVTIDTVRADHLGAYGYARPTSPVLDRLAAEGSLFLNGWAHAPSTRYSMPALATGRWPSTIDWDESIWWPRIAAGVPTVAEVLKANGYFTAAFYSFDYFSVADRRGFERGVDLYRADRATLHRAVNGPMESHGSSSREMADDAITFFEQHQQQKFFLWVHFYDPHLSYEPHAEVPSFGSARADLYDGEIRFTDLHVGRLLERLRTLGLWDRTAVVVTGDHGEGFGEHGVTEHGFDLYAAQTKVPLIIRVPGLAPRRITTPAGHVDIAPTLVNLARGSRPPTFLGRSLVNELERGDAGATPGAVAVFQEVTSERGKKRALVTDTLHVIWNWTPDNTTECYDRRTDPEERRDVWDRSGDVKCRRLKSDLQGLVSALSVPLDLGPKLKAGVFAAGAAAPQPAKAIGANIGDLVAVEGYTLTPSSGLSPSREVELATLFTCRKPIAGGWRLFFHLMGPQGTFRNLDHLPLGGAMPLDRWRPGQRIFDRMTIPFPPGTPPGTYQIIVGLFRGTERLPITPPALSDGKQALRLATVQVP